MPNFKVTITETLEKVVEIEAKDVQEAELIAKNRWKRLMYTLNAEDFTGVEVKAEELTEKESN